jgi:hypothetical protein
MSYFSIWLLLSMSAFGALSVFVFLSIKVFKQISVPSNSEHLLIG